MKKIAFIFPLIVIFFFACSKEKILEDSSAKLEFSNTIVKFDTIFTTIGSTTKRFLVYNQYDKKLIISSISLKNGSQSLFRINVDGVSGDRHQDVEIGAKDSIFVFVEVTINPTPGLTPFVVEDQVIFQTNGNQQHVDLLAWGQDAHYFVPQHFTSNLPPYSCLTGDCSSSTPPVTVTWTNDKPYVIFDYLVVDSADKLIIEKGVRVHFHNNSGLWVYKDGSLEVNGTVDEPVTFQGTRLDMEYRDISGQWDRIWINEGGTHNITHAEIKNAFIGIQAEPLPTLSGMPSLGALNLNAVKILNAQAIGLFSKNYSITDNNSIIANCGQYNLLAQGSGDYHFTHTTFANYWSEGSRSTPVILLQNYYADDNITAVGDITSAIFDNCIIAGNNEREIEIYKHEQGMLNYELNYCLLSSDTSLPTYNNVLLYDANTPLFKDRFENDYTLTDDAVAIDKGNPAISLTTDHDNNPRNDGKPDIGAYEK